MPPKYKLSKHHSSVNKEAKIIDDTQDDPEKISLSMVTLPPLHMKNDSGDTQSIQQTPDVRSIPLVEIPGFSGFPAIDTSSINHSHSETVSLSFGESLQGDLGQSTVVADRQLANQSASIHGGAIKVFDANGVVGEIDIETIKFPGFSVMDTTSVNHSRSETLSQSVGGSLQSNHDQPPVVADSMLASIYGGAMKVFDASIDIEVINSGHGEQSMLSPWGGGYP